ncbi:hypothetical protein J5500_04340 [Candidatus Saccharibacteria bacterium]|nr:hypothetical protein [Candidatus Saccharibacteria bacterium]
MQDNQSPTIPNGTPQKTNATNNKIIFAACIIGGALIVLSLIVIIGAFFKPNNTPQNNENDVKVDALLKDEEATPSTTITELDFILEEKGADEYIKQFQKAIDLASNAETKAEYYLARADGLYNYDLSEENGFLHQAQILADAKEAEKISPSIDSAQALYTYADAFGDNDLASYYENLFDERSAESVDAID